MRKIFFVVSLLIITSCHQKNGPPAGIISKDKMQNILEDIHFAQVEVNMRRLTPDSAKKVEVAYYTHILHLHHVTTQQFLDSFDYYIQHPDIMDDMYQNMVNDLSKNINTSPVKPIRKK